MPVFGLTAKLEFGVGGMGVDEVGVPPGVLGAGASPFGVNLA